MQLKNRIYGALNRPLGRPLLAMAASVVHSVRSGARSRVSWRGHWVHRLPDRFLVERAIVLASAERLDRNTQERWFHTYTPRRGDVVFDIGAATGWETIVLSRLVGPTGRVIAIEAHPHTFDCLRRMIQLNALTNVTPLCCAVADSPGWLSITDLDQYVANSIVDARSGLTVPARTLEEICETERLSDIAFVKLNIEGAEYLALRGLGEGAHRVRHVVISCHDFKADRGLSVAFRTKHDVREWMHRHGFAITERTTDKRAPVRDYLYGDRTPTGRGTPAPASDAVSS